ncbi:TRAP transporter small permease subunit [Paracidovorax sp. MALMAid1276]|uniref:TRAP transporter small permease subunit n=1 Tax=Paracidovorax sp. MALMAid1276 TaxID=3411631 RepID=UPI003B9BCB42
MQALLKFSRAVDWLSNGVGKLSMWLILATTLISAGNAIVRKTLNTSSNALLEIQWYLFAAVFMLGAGYCLLKNAHVRIDFIASRLSARTRNWIDVVGILVVLFPFCFICIRLGWPLFMQAFESGEMSQSAGGLIRWPVYALIPAGFALLMLQGVSELIKRIAFLKGQGPDSLAHDAEEAEEERLAAEMAAALEKKNNERNLSKAG